MYPESLFLGSLSYKYCNKYEISQQFEQILNRNDIPNDAKELLSDFLHRINELEVTIWNSKEIYHKFLSKIPAVTWIADEKTRTQYISPNVERILGYTPEEVYQKGHQFWFENISHFCKYFITVFSSSNWG